MMEIELNLKNKGKHTIAIYKRDVISEVIKKLIEDKGIKSRAQIKGIEE